ncbi:unnamed protein product [marine sediment metagenome]|uniref:Uncharacterized protein n=1 Tax=marine sediment metagenome TaxID=412755 RepID=X1FWW3_9ZZZZ
MSYTEKIDVLELLIKILMEHEKRLDELVYSLELLVERLDIEGSMPDILGVDPSDVDARLEDMR